MALVFLTFIDSLFIFNHSVTLFHYLFMLFTFRSSMPHNDCSIICTSNEV